MKKHTLAALGLSLCLLLSACGATAAAGDGEIPGIGTHSSPSAGTEDAGAMGLEESFAVDMEEPAAPAPGDEAGRDPNAPAPAAGTLTAGEWDDCTAFDAWLTLLEQPYWQGIGESWGLTAQHRVAVRVTDEAGAPCVSTSVELLGGGSVLYTARTDAAGMAYLYYDVDGAGQTVPESVRAGDVEANVTDGAAELTLPVRAEAPSKLDLMFMVDATGSMGDELAYIKEELADVVSRVEEATGFAVRTSVNFYRDTEDEYIVRYFDFKAVGQSLQDLAPQIADGGGDYPEAVHTALDNAVNGHVWDEDAVKLCILVLDAPPHDEADVKAQLRTLLPEAAEKGVRVIPVVSSGADETTEYLCRTFALLTGGTYVFLTDDSGVGGEHLEPTVGAYTVEPLNDCLVRIIQRYCGRQTAVSAYVPDGQG